MRTVRGLFALASAVALFHCSSLPDTCYGSACDGPDGSSSDAGDAGADVVQPPQGCDASADPKDAPKCVDDSFGVFADATNGSDGNAGTRESPVKSITAALGKLAGKSRVYVCAGTYPEHVTLASAVSLYGGFACGTWSYDGTKPNLAPADAGPALTFTATPAGVAIEDLQLTAQAGTAATNNSVAVFASNAAGVTFTRCALAAAAGFDGKPGDSGITGTPDKPLDGNSANMTTAGPGLTCTCSVGGATSGGAGGAVLSDGQKGGPSTIPENPTGHNGDQGIGNQSCSGTGSTGSGNPGADAADAADALAITTLGLLSATAWVPSSGSAGADASVGQGGGGGGGRGGAGGGGACGGCGGSGGKPGGSGGASVALLSFHSTLSLATSTLTSAKAGDGGAGGSGGGAGAGGGGGGAVGGAPNGCGGGDGGKGGNGGGGSGGAGGVSAAVLYAGPQPSADNASMLTPGSAGAAGAAGGASNAGPAGAAGTNVQATEQ